MNKSGLLNITLVIACRNEMPQQLPKWDCPVIIVDDHSDNSQFTIYNSQFTKDPESSVQNPLIIVHCDLIITQQLELREQPLLQPL